MKYFKPYYTIHELNISLQQSDLDIVYTEIVDKLDIVYFSLQPILMKYTEIVDNLDKVY